MSMKKRLFIKWRNIRKLTKKWWTSKTNQKNIHRLWVIPCYYIGTTAVLWFIQHNKIIASLYDFWSNNLRMAFGPKRYPFQDAKWHYRIPCTRLYPENHTLFSATYPYRQIREGAQYVTHTHLFNWVIEEEGTNRVEWFTKQARL